MNSPAQQPQVLITCGPTSEMIDQVRRITNHSTGTLGIRLARFFQKNGLNAVLFISSDITSKENVEAFHVEKFKTSHNLYSMLQSFSQHVAWPALVLHCAAVSDFLVSRVEDGDGNLLLDTKISGDIEELVIRFTRAPKILPRLAEWFPKSNIIGWKYELDGGREQALERGKKQIRECATRACVVNGTAYGEGYGLMDKNFMVVHCADWEELGTKLLKIALEKN